MAGGNRPYAFLIGRWEPALLWLRPVSIIVTSEMDFPGWHFDFRDLPLSTHPFRGIVELTGIKIGHFERNCTAGVVILAVTSDFCDSIGMDDGHDWCQRSLPLAWSIP